MSEQNNQSSGQETAAYCKVCDGAGTISTGIAEASSTQCRFCDGTGYAAPAPVAEPAALTDEHEALLGEAERIAANLYKTGHYLAARVMRMLAAQPAEPARADRQALSDEDIQRRWDEACKDGPGRPGWSRHIRFARDIEHRAIAAFLENTRQYVTNDASRKAAIADAIAADRADRQGVALSEKTILEIAQPWFGEETKHLRLHLVEFALAVARAAYPSARASNSRAEVEIGDSDAG